MNNQIIVYLLFFSELLAFATGLVYWKKVKNSYWKWFVVYLGVIFTTEMLGAYFKHFAFNNDLNRNLYLYFGIPIQFLFFFWLFSKNSGRRRAGKWFLIPAVIYVSCIFLEIIYLKEIKTWFSSFSYTMGNLLLVILIIDYLLKFINNDDILNYKKNMMFWVSLGLAVFYLLTFPFYALRNTLYFNYRGIFNFYQSVQLILDCLMYLIFSLAFIWGKPK